MNIFDTYRELTPTSEALHRQSREFFPGGVSHNLRSYFPHPVYLRSARGARIVDADGREYLDLWMGHFALIFGHLDPGTQDALRGTLDRGWHSGVPSAAQVELASRIRRAVPSMERMRFCATGTEAAMYAVRLAQAFTGRSLAHGDAELAQLLDAYEGAARDLAA